MMEQIITDVGVPPELKGQLSALCGPPPLAMMLVRCGEDVAPCRRRLDLNETRLLRLRSVYRFPLGFSAGRDQ